MSTKTTKPILEQIAKLLEVLQGGLLVLRQAIEAEPLGEELAETLDDDLSSVEMHLEDIGFRLRGIDPNTIPVSELLFGPVATEQEGGDSGELDTRKG